MRSLEQQWEWLQRTKPAYLDTMPSLVRWPCEARGRQFGAGLKKILTAGEVVDASLRSLAAKRLGATIHDKYSTQEAGCMAIQCPECTSYHVQSEAVIVEVLDDSGRPCRPGEIGRVVVTPFFNFATPLIRYDVGDFAEVGATLQLRAQPSDAVADHGAAPQHSGRARWEALLADARLVRLLHGRAEPRASIPPDRPQ